MTKGHLGFSFRNPEYSIKNVRSSGSDYFGKAYDDLYIEALRAEEVDTPGDSDISTMKVVGRVLAKGGLVVRKAACKVFKSNLKPCGPSHS